jgi:hypothetical protein
MYFDKKSPHIDFADSKYLVLGDKYLERNDEIVMYNKLQSEVIVRDTHWEHQKRNAKEEIEVYNGNPFTPNMLQRYREEGMKPVASKRIKRDLNTIADNVFRGRQIGVVKKIKDEEGAISTSDINEIIQKMMFENNFEHKAYNNILKSAMISGFFTYAELEIEGQINGIGKPKMITYDWDCVLPAPMFNNNFWECNDIITINYQTPDKLRATFPHRRKAIDDMMAKNYDEDEVQNLDVRIKANTQQQLNEDIYQNSKSSNDDMGRGLIAVYDWKRPIFVKTVVYVMRNMPDEVLLPINWDEERIHQWELAHPEYKKEERYQLIQWRTIWTGRGLVLYNNEHWYQNDCKLNGCLFACEMSNRKPEGFVRIAVDLIRMLSAAQTEGLYQITNGAGKEAHHIDGTLKYPEELQDTMKKRTKIFEYNDSANMNDFIIRNSQPDTSFINYANSKDDELDKTLGITDDIQGRTKASSSNFRTETAILQTMTSYAEYMRNLTEWWVQMSDLYLSCIPYVFNDKSIKYTTMPLNSRADGHEIEINQKEVVEETDGNRKYYALKTIANDPTKGKYAYIVYPDSPSALTRAESEDRVNAFMNGVGNTLLQMGENKLIWALKNHYDPVLSEMGYNMEKDMQEQQEAAEQQMQVQAQQPSAADMPNPQLSGQAMALQQSPSGEIPQQMIMNGMNPNAPAMAM